MKFGDAALDWFNDLSMQGILMTDAELNICGWNRWLEIHSGRSSTEMIGRNLLEACPDLVARRLDEYYRNALAGQVRVVSQRLHGYLLPMPPTIEGAHFDQMQQSARNERIGWWNCWKAKRRPAHKLNTPTGPRMNSWRSFRMSFARPLTQSSDGFRSCKLDRLTRNPGPTR